jgi:hypothetical protein
MKLQCNFREIPSFCLVFLCGALFLTETVRAQEIIENVKVTFGEVVLIDNSSPKTVELLPSGDYVSDPEYIFFTEPKLGNVTVTGYPAFTALSVAVSNATLVAGGSAAIFTTDNTYTNPINVITNADGSATFDIGATLSSDGSGTAFGSSHYKGDFTITVSPL